MHKEFFCKETALNSKSLTISLVLDFFSFFFTEKQPTSQPTIIQNAVSIHRHQSSSVSIMKQEEKHPAMDQTFPCHLCLESCFLVIQQSSNMQCVFQEQTCFKDLPCCHTEIQVEDYNCNLTQSILTPGLPILA